MLPMSGLSSSECLLVARNCRSGMSANRSLPGDKRTTYAQCEFFAF